MAMGGRLVGTLSPVLVAGIAALAGGVDGWRWSFLVLGIPVAVVAFFAFRLPEPPRGQFEKQDVLGQVIEDKAPAPISVEAAFARLWQIRTIKTRDRGVRRDRLRLVHHGGAREPVHGGAVRHEDVRARRARHGRWRRRARRACRSRGVTYDRLYRRDPSRALRLVGMMILPAALLTPAQYLMPNVVLFAIMGVPQMILLTVAFTMVGPLLQTITPYRLRGMGTALGSIYIFLIGATGGALLSGLLADEFGPGVAVVAIVVPSTVIGGFLIIRSARFIRNDLSLVVAELREEMEEHTRQVEAPDVIPALQVVNVDYSYGPVQVLFDVGFEVRRGEVLALLGTNGAGKSTIFRVIAGLGTPARGVVRLNGRNVTYTTPEQRARLGIRILLGGKGVFPAMTVQENLEMAAFVYRSDDADFQRRLDRAYDLFPALAEKRRGAGVDALGRPAADAGAGDDVAARSRGARHRRAVARARTAGRAGAARGGRTAQGGGDDDHHRGAVAERGALRGRSCGVPREGPGALQRSGRRARRAGRPRPRGVPRNRRRLIVGVVGTWITNQLVFNGVVSGLLFGLLAMGIVLIYRSTRVINFAVGNMGLVGASFLALLVVNFGVPFWLAAIAALVLGTLFGAVMELVVVRRLFFAPRVIMLVATIGISGLSLAIVAVVSRRSRTSTRRTRSPSTSPGTTSAGVGSARTQVAVLVVVPLVAIALGWFLNRTLVGRTVKASAENPDLARVQGINPKVVSTVVWAIAGFVATLTMILIAGDSRPGPRSPVLGPNTLVRALAAAVIAGIVSFPRAMVGRGRDRRHPGAHQLQLPRQAGTHRPGCSSSRSSSRSRSRAAVPVPSRPRRSRSRRRSARFPINCATCGGCAG